MITPRVSLQLAAFAFAALVTTLNAAESGKPNVLMIVADDFGVPAKWVPGNRRTPVAPAAAKATPAASGTSGQ